VRNASFVIDGYDLLAEQNRLAYADVVVCGRAINRGSALVDVDSSRVPGEAEARARHDKFVVRTTLSGERSPAIDLSYPATGMFVSSSRGVYLDLYHGVGQRLIDEHHPSFRQTLAALMGNELAFRREINTDDYEFFSERIAEIVEPQDLAELVTGMVSESFPGSGPYKCFFSNSGAEAGEAAMKLAMLNCYRRFIRRHGMVTFERVTKSLGIERDSYFDLEGRSREPVFQDYPFFIVACDGAFHGRTLGVLGLTRSKGVHQIGFGKSRWTRHVAFNGSVSDLRNLLDVRPIGEILDSPGGVLGSLATGRIPVDLVSAFFTEVYQGEGGYRLAERPWLLGIVAECRRHGILVGIDEVQSLGRTGRLFALEHYGVDPDIVWTAKGAVLGITVAKESVCEVCTEGWHSNTFGSGKLFDVNMSYVTFRLLRDYLDPVYEGRTYLDNSRIKGEYFRLKLAELMARHDETLIDFSGLGGMWGLTVRNRDAIIDWGWKLGVKLLGCGIPGEVSRLRVLLLTDVLTREIDQAIAVLDRVLEQVESSA